MTITQWKEVGSKARHLLDPGQPMPLPIDAFAHQSREEKTFAKVTLH